MCTVCVQYVCTRCTSQYVCRVARLCTYRAIIFSSKKKQRLFYADKIVVLGGGWLSRPVWLAHRTVRIDVFGPRGLRLALRLWAAHKNGQGIRQNLLLSASWRREYHVICRQRRRYRSTQRSGLVALARN